MQNQHIGFIGGGNMATSLIGGLIKAGIPVSQLHVADPDSEKLAGLHQHFGITTHDNNGDLATVCDVIVLAVKPQVMKDVVTGFAQGIKDNAMIISIAAGIRVVDLEHWIAKQVAIVRTMPNTPALVSQGATGLFANPHVSEAQKHIANEILAAVGTTVWVEHENLLDAVTAVSGSGPAYFFMLMEHMIAAGQSLGLSEDVARELVLQTALGAATLSRNSEDTPSQLRAKVTSPGGTTERALNIFADNNMSRIVNDALRGAAQRAQELGDQLGEQSKEQGSNV